MTARNSYNREKQVEHEPNTSTTSGVPVRPDCRTLEVSCPMDENRKGRQRETSAGLQAQAGGVTGPLLPSLGWHGTPERNSQTPTRAEKRGQRARKKPSKTTRHQTTRQGPGQQDKPDKAPETHEGRKVNKQPKQHVCRAANGTIT